MERVAAGWSEGLVLTGEGLPVPGEGSPSETMPGKGRAQLPEGVRGQGRSSRAGPKQSHTGGGGGPPRLMPWRAPLGPEAPSASARFSSWGRWGEGLHHPGEEGRLAAEPRPALPPQAVTSGWRS